VIPAPDGVRLQFAAAPAERAASGEATLVTELRFVALDGQMKLAESIPPAHLAQLVPRELIDRAVEAACKPEISLAPPGARFDIQSLDASVFPDTAPDRVDPRPAHEREADGAYVYRFCLLPCDAGARPLARFAYRFGADGRLERGDFAYFRYRLLGRSTGRRATLSLRLT
jgi:hypothetical protein